MARVTADEVRGIYRGIPASTDITPFINVANVVVTQRLTGAYPDPYLKEIELWLSAHFYEVDNPRRNDISIGERRSEDRFESKIDLNLNLTRPGQQVDFLDYKNILNDSGRKQPRTIIWLGEVRQGNSRCPGEIRT